MPSHRPWRHLLVVALLAVVLSIPQLAEAQGSRRNLEEDEANVTVDPKHYSGLNYRDIGFTRGGRSVAVTGVHGDSQTYYMGGTGGGVFKTTDAGITWTPVTDGQIGAGSIGSIRVAASDPNVIYVGTGEGCPRGNVSVGDGMYRSTDGGKTWAHAGLPNAGQIPHLRIHPTNPDIVYAAALGHIFGPNEDRGVYRTMDGGSTWEKVLYIDEETGFYKVEMDANNPRVLYATGWRVERKPWSLISGNEKGGIWKSTDGGDNWTKLGGGLPTGLVGKIDITVSPANSNRVWALIEAEGERGGLYRSDNAGATWRRINGDANLRQRPWYYIHIYADPQNENVVYGLNTGFYKSIDGGVTFTQTIQVPHGDNHDLWINPDNPQNMINANDGGANVSFNGGGSWSWQMNQPTSQMYRVFVDDDWPYRVYGSQQDNSTISVPSSQGGGGFGGGFPPDWYPVGGCESGHIAIDPRDNSIVYAGCYGGSITRVDRNTGSSREILAYPQLQLGAAPRDLKYRFQWNAPIRISPHDPDVVYHTSQVIHRTSNGGQTWEVISPDLTTDNQETQDYAGGPISHDSTGVEVYNTIFAFEESPHQAGLMWTGSDDGKVHISRDGGDNWTDITPADMPPGGTVNVIDLSAHDPGRAHMAVYRYRENDFAPYIFQTSDFGENWTLVTDGSNGIPATHPVRAIREDPVRQGLLFAGTEFGMYVSFDDGAHWQDFQKNLPVVPITDLQIKRGDLVVATQGRSFWIMDDISVLREAANDTGMKLYTPRPAYRSGQGPARVHFYFDEAPEGEVTLTIMNSAGDTVGEYKGTAGAPAPSGGPGGFFAALFGGAGADLQVKQGHNTFQWGLRETAPNVPGDVVLWGFAPGRMVPPGDYTVRLSTGDWSEETTLTVGLNPKLGQTVEGAIEQYEFLGEVGEMINELYGALGDLRKAKQQSMAVVERMKAAGVDADDVAEAAEAMNARLTEVEEQITQVKSKSGQDPINFPPQIDNQVVTLYGYALGGFGGGDDRPTDAAYTRLEDLRPGVQSLIDQVEAILAEDLQAFNDLVASKNLPAVVISGDDGM